MLVYGGRRSLRASREPSGAGVRVGSCWSAPGACRDKYVEMVSSGLCIIAASLWCQLRWSTFLSWKIAAFHNLPYFNFHTSVFWFFFFFLCLAVCYVTNSTATCQPKRRPLFSHVTVPFLCISIKKKFLSCTKDAIKSLKHNYQFLFIITQVTAVTKY